MNVSRIAAGWKGVRGRQNSGGMSSRIFQDGGSRILGRFRGWICPYNSDMRKVLLGLGISIDGYLARANGTVDFLFMS
jgi:hypothetical protein